MARMIAKTNPNQSKSEAIKSASHTSKHLKWAKIALISSVLLNVCLIVRLLTTI